MAGARAVDQDACSISVLKRFERSLCVWIDGRDGRCGPWLGAAGGEAFHLADAHAAAGDAARQLDAFFRIGNREKCAAVTGREPALFD